MSENTKAVEAEVSNGAERGEGDTTAAAIGDLAVRLRALDGAHDMLELARLELAGALTGLAELLERLPDDLRDGARAIAAAAVRRHAAREPDRDPISALVTSLLSDAKTSPAAARRPRKLPSPQPAEDVAEPEQRPHGRRPLGSMSRARAMSLLRSRGYTVGVTAHPGAPYRVDGLRLSGETLVGMAERLEAGLDVSLLGAPAAPAPAAPAPWPAEAEPEQPARRGGRPQLGSMTIARALEVLRSRGYRVATPRSAGDPYRVGDMRLSSETLVGMAERLEAGLDPSLPGAPQPTPPPSYHDAGASRRTDERLRQ